MGESTCIMRPFSYASGISNEANQENPRPALGESVSFGRFMSESLAWDKWSTFSQNRYVEEAERYAQPGSVAQKKAFFEAHYKRIASQKAAAALLEQANAACNTAETEARTEVCNNDTSHDSHTPLLESQVVVDQQQEVKTQYLKQDLVDKDEEHNSNVQPSELENAEKESLVKNCTNNGSLNLEEEHSFVSENSGTPEIEKPLLKNYNSNHNVPRTTSKKKPVVSSLKPSSKIPSPPTKPKGPLHQRKENITPASKKSKMDSRNKKRPIPQTLGTLLNFTPAKDSDNATSLAVRKIECSRVAPSSTSFKESRDCATPLRTPITAFVNEMQGHPLATPLVTPCSEIRRNQTPFDPSKSGSKTTGKWLSSVCSKSISACRRKLQSPTLSSPFILRTEERAARRKQKLEEKFNDNGVQKVQLQAKLKEKAETELRKLRQSLCFKARPLPNFYKERETPDNQIKKTLHMHPQPTKPGRKPSTSTTRGTISLHPPISSIKGNPTKNVLKKNSESSTLSQTIIHENTSPNIQHETADI